ncbi:hypothetical protein LZ337_00130 [Serratia marcescens]|uniref:hypothetical protein n=1 Tax=Serratia TaxID=613 RepID=UPI000A4F8D46|nr:MULTISPECIES: hypothetical protein [Serratia]EGT3593561.1 hypothetical protein [Serratia marcescens]MDK4800444.1 hypothetical protein [Serratia nevei]MDM1798011.1 hypothetical protein [Serratia marcescens]MEC5634095.1 hypothetical protein [Serratia nevei]MEC5735876.1 hypothetical protein [Serratia nevei]
MSCTYCSKNTVGFYECIAIVMANPQVLQVATVKNRGRDLSGELSIMAMPLADYLWRLQSSVGFFSGNE